MDQNEYLTIHEIAEAIGQSYPTTRFRLSKPECQKYAMNFARKVGKFTVYHRDVIEVARNAGHPTK